MNSLAYFFYHAGLIHEKFIIGQHFKIFVCELVFKQTAILTIIPFPINIKNAFGDIIPHVETRGNINAEMEFTMRLSGSFGRTQNKGYILLRFFVSASCR